MLLTHLFEQIETRDAGEVWSEISSNAASYMPSQTYLVKPSEKKSGTFDVYVDKNNRRTLYASVSKVELASTYEIVRADDKPDGEGYVRYRMADELEAAQYTGEPVNLTVGTSTARLKKGDYLVRSTSGDDFTYSVEPEKFFDLTYVKA